jgi:asparagine synthase (glutamine-hydrolysing)
MVATHVGAVSHKVEVDSGGLARDLDDMLVAQGEPFGSTSIYAQYVVYRAFREQGVTVSLDGQGADELLAGYHGYPGHRLRSMLERGRYGEAAAFLGRWSRWPGRGSKRALLEFGSVLAPDWLRPLGLRLVGSPQVPSWVDSDAAGDLRWLHCRLAQHKAAPKDPGQYTLEPDH